VVVALASDDDPLWPGWTTLQGKPVIACIGGGERADSVLAALHALPTRGAGDELLLVHDAARPNLQADDIGKLIDAATRRTDGAILAAPVRDTLKRAGDDANASRHRIARWPVARADPAGVPSRPVAARAAVRRGRRRRATDEAMAVERLGLHPALVEGREDNLKVTTPADLALAEFLLGRASR
jgi:2-C-methyl-D-erythritol 4-phosphate cytidylyltransferase